MIPLQNKNLEIIKLSEYLSSSNLRDYRDDDFWIDRLCHRYSVIVFAVFAILVTTKAYVGDPIDCWAPPEFKVGCLNFNFENNFNSFLNHYLADIQNKSAFENLDPKLSTI